MPITGTVLIGSASAPCLFDSNSVMTMTWYTEHRQEWIKEMMYVYGFINREHLVRKFAISVLQASHDLNAYMRFNPGHIVYNKATKRYEIPGCDV